MTSTPSPSAPGLSRLRRASSPSRSWKPLAFTAGAILLFAVLVWQLFGDRLRPGVPVEVARTLLLPGDPSAADPGDTASAGETLFQSSGWIEADPWPVRVVALADGIVDTVHFQEGDRVARDQLLVRMITEDEELRVKRLRHRAMREAHQSDAHEADADAAARSVEIARAREQRAEADLAEGRDRWERIRDLRLEEVTEFEKVSAKQRFLQRDAALREAAAETRRAEAEATRARAAAEAQVQRRRAAEVELEEAELRLRRLEIRAPVDGVVQQRLVEPGAKRIRATDNPDSATVALMYDPRHLQVRVDVPLAEAGKLEIDQPATVTTALLPGRDFDGVVVRIVGRADLQRNTLQAKVAIRDPDPRMRPDVLCRVAFHDPGPSGRDAVSGASHALWIPASLVAGSEREAEVWVVDPLDRTVSSRVVTPGPATRAGLRQIRDGLRPNEWVVVHTPRPLRPGDRVSVQNDDL